MGTHIFQFWKVCIYVCTYLHVFRFWKEYFFLDFLLSFSLFSFSGTLTVCILDFFESFSTFLKFPLLFPISLLYLHFIIKKAGIQRKLMTYSVSLGYKGWSWKFLHLYNGNHETYHQHSWEDKMRPRMWKCL